MRDTTKQVKQPKTATRSLTLTVAESVAQWAEQQATQRGYKSAADFARSLIIAAYQAAQGENNK